MTRTPLACIESLQIGTVDFISSDEVRVMLDVEAPESVALNAGGVRPFPRVNGYVLVPADGGFLVGQVEWLTIERSAFPKRRGVQDFGLIDLPYPLRRMKLNPLGVLHKKEKRKHENETEDEYEFCRGSESLPSLGSPVLLPTEKQLKSIVESGENRHIRIGISPLAGDAIVSIDPDRFFGRHVAVLGNTGGGKSCSVAGLVRWSIEQSAEERGGLPNARYIILDPNGEYAKAFQGQNDGIKATVFRVNHQEDEKALNIPLWLLNSAEWCAFTQASAKTQRPTLIQALRYAREGVAVPNKDKSHNIRVFIRTIIITIRAELNSGAPWGVFPKPKNFWDRLGKWCRSLQEDLHKVEGNEHTALSTFVDVLDKLYKEHVGGYPNYIYSREEILELLQVGNDAHSAFGGNISDLTPTDVDVPVPFTSEDLLRSIEAASEILGVSEHTETLLIRLRSLLRNSQIAQILNECSGVSMDEWLDDILGQGGRCHLSIIDLSLVPSEVVHIVTASMARIVFEALQRYRKKEAKSLPTVLIMEEAHNFVKRYKEEYDNPDMATICCQVFERIAREGRKFGLGLVVSSQRPSELSPTVLSQCNTFLIHRISNDKDQELVGRLVPDNLRGLLRELPSLPSQHAILLGWASEVPVLVKIDELPKEQRPRSDDPDFWEVWTGNGDERNVNWKEIVNEWQNNRDHSSEINDD